MTSINSITNSALLAAFSTFGRDSSTVNQLSLSLATGLSAQPGSSAYSLSLTTPIGAYQGLDKTLNDALGFYSTASQNASTIQTYYATLLSDAQTLSQSNLSQSARDKTVADFTNTLTAALGLTSASSGLFQNPFGSDTISVIGSITGGQLVLGAGGGITDALNQIQAAITSTQPGNGGSNGNRTGNPHNPPLDLNSPTDAAQMVDLLNSLQPQIDQGTANLASGVDTLTRSIAQNQKVLAAAQQGLQSQIGADPVETGAKLSIAQAKVQTDLSAISSIVAGQVGLYTGISQMLQTTESAILAYQKPQAQFPVPTITNLLA